MRRIILTLLLVTIFSVPLMAQTITFAWDSYAQAADVTGFKLYASKTSGSYTTTPYATFAGGSTVTGTVAKPTSPGKWYFVLTAYATDAESDYSNEVSTVIKPNKPTGFKITVISALGNAIKGLFQTADLRKKQDSGLRIKED